MADMPMGKGPGGSNDVSVYLRQAQDAYAAGRISKQQYLDWLDYYAPEQPPVPLPTPDPRQPTLERRDYGTRPVKVLPGQYDALPQTRIGGKIY